MISTSSAKGKNSTAKKGHASSFSTNNDKLTAAIDYVMKSNPLHGMTKMGNIDVLAKSKEVKRCVSIKVILKEYADRCEEFVAGKDAKPAKKLNPPAKPKPPSPLSIAVFGPPGSGKSTYVRAIVNDLKEKLREYKLANLSQFSSPIELIETFTDSTPDDKRTKVFFIDEFDAELNDISLGWLRYFLAPMQDGEFRWENKAIKLGPAIFLFAGGTAPSLEEFEKRSRLDPASYREKKVPDFISRLRGFIDIQGINNLDNEREMRRALVLRANLEKRWPKRKKRSGSFPIDKSFVRSLLTSAHFVHGVRSMEALLDMCQLKPDQTLSKRHLPDQELSKLHISRGLLDNTIVGISTGLEDKGANLFLNDLTKELLRNGATLAYGGEFREEGTLNSIVQTAENFPDDLVKRDDKRVRNYLGFPAFNSERAQSQRTKGQHQIEFLDLETLSKFERQALGVQGKSWFVARPDGSDAYNPNHHLAWAISLFRMRVRLVQDISALVVVGGKGKDEESWGRFSGIAEEVMLAVTLGKPVYVLGGRGGAAHTIGQLLGLDEALANPNARISHNSGVETNLLHENFGKCFAMPGYPNLPRTINEVRHYLFERSLLTPGWNQNGLDICENRKLFRTKITTSNWGNCVKLIVGGLTRLKPSESRKID